MIFYILTLALTQATPCDLPNLSSGHFNLTSEKAFKDLSKKEPLFLLAVSAKWCSHCCKSEPILSEVQSLLDTKNLKLARADLSTQTYLSKLIDKVDPLPHVYIVYKGELHRYENELGPFLLTYIDVYFNPFQIIHTQTELDSFFQPEERVAIKIVGFIYDTSEDYFSGYESTRIKLIDWSHTKFGLVTDKSLIKHLKSSQKYIFYLNSLVLSYKNDFKTLDLEADSDILSFITSNSISAVEELTPITFQVLKAMGNPILVLFIDKSNLAHQDYIQMLEKASRDYSGLIRFAWMDGTTPENKEKKKSVGLLTDNLPSMSFNLLEGKVQPYSEQKPITLEAIHMYCADLINNRLETGIKKVGKAKNVEIEEKFKNTPSILFEEIEGKVLTEGVDVMLLLYSSGAEGAAAIAPNFNKAALRFNELKIKSLKIYRIDVDTEPVHINIGTYIWPAILFFPAFHKTKPFIQFTGEARAVQLMFFAKRYADIKFELPILPHLSEDQVPAYWEQVADLDEEKRKKVAAANERRDYF